MTTQAPSATPTAAVQTPVPFVDLKSQYASIKPEVDAAMADVLARTNFILGDVVGKFEREFADFVGAKHAVGVASGTDALHVALRALGIGPGDEVIVPANTYIATALGAWMCGARPVLVDCDPVTYNIDVRAIEARLTRRTRAILPVHLYGQPADMDEVMALAKARNLLVVEDACQSHGSRYKGQASGNIGAAGCYSFYPGKNLGAYGDGGMVTTNDDGIAERLRLLRDYGQRVKYHHDIKGFNSRLDTLQAAVLRVKLRHLSDWNAARKRAAARYTEMLRDLPVVTPAIASDRDHIFHLYVIRTRHRDALLTWLGARGIGVGIHYPIPIYRQKCFSEMQWGGAMYPVTDGYADHLLSLPIFPEITEQQQRTVVSAMREFFQEGPGRGDTVPVLPAAPAPPPPSPAVGDDLLPNLSIVIPALNEEGSLEGVVRKAVGVAREIARESEVLIVDDGSRDRTAEIADRLAHENPGIRVIHHPFNIGYGGGQRSGFMHAKYDYLTFVPADNQFDVEDLKKFLPHMRHADAVIGIRIHRQDSNYRRLKTRIFRWVMRVLFGITLHDINWVKMFRKSALGDFDVEHRGIGIDAEVVVMAKHRGCRFAEVEVGYHPRTTGIAKGDQPINVLITILELLSLWWRLKRK